MPNGVRVGLVGLGCAQKLHENSLLSGFRLCLTSGLSGFRLCLMACEWVSVAGALGAALRRRGLH